MIRPTARLVLIFVGGIPLALFVVIYNPALWPLSFNYAALVMLAAASDFLLALRPRALSVRIATPDRVAIGERGVIAATLAAPAYRRNVRFELIAERWPWRRTISRSSSRLGCSMMILNRKRSSCASGSG